MKRLVSAALCAVLFLACTTACGSSNDKEQCDEYLCVSPATYVCSSPVAVMKVTMTAKQSFAAYAPRATQDKQERELPAQAFFNPGDSLTEAVKARESAELVITTAQGRVYTRTFDREDDCETSA